MSIRLPRISKIRQAIVVQWKREESVSTSHCGQIGSVNQGVKRGDICVN